MTQIDGSSATAARRILGLEEVTYAESGVGDDRVQALLQTFYSLAQLTPDLPLPEAVTNGVNEQLAAETDGMPTSNGNELVDLTGPLSANRRVVERRQRVKRALTARVRMPITALVMLVAALALSIGANILLSRAGQFRPEVAVHMTGTDSSPGSRGALLFDGRQMVLYASGLAELTSGYRYVAWNASGSEPQYLGSLTMLSDSTARLLISADAMVQIVVVTIEPSASPGAPTGPPILVGRAID